MVLVTFRIEYSTRYGENIALITAKEGETTPESWDPSSNALTMSYNSKSRIWELDLEIEGKAERIEYKYLLNAAGNWTWEHGGNRVLNLARFKNIEAVEVNDSWRSYSNIADIEDSKVLSDVIFRREPVSKGTTPIAEPQKDHVMMRCVPVSSNRQVGIIGSSPSMGNWTKPIVMKPVAAETKSDVGENFFWTSEIEIPLSEVPFTYKYVILGDKSILSWESRENRVFPLSHIQMAGKVPRHKAIVIADSPFIFGKNFQGCGVSVPIFSLRTENSLGIGEYTDLIPFADFASKCGFSLVQLLPINDTSSRLSWRDSYPYGTLSVFALHPIYLNLQSVGKLPDEMEREISAFKEEMDLNQGGDIDLDYERVFNFKMKMLRRAYELHWKELKGQEEFKRYFEEQSDWLKAYALFAAVRDAHLHLKKPANFEKWSEFRTIDEDTLAKVTSDEGHKYASAIRFYYFLQYHCHRQMMAAVSYVHGKGIALKGDLPIGVQLHSVDVWRSPQLFKTEMSTGAPPDNFSADGQNWGFPTYNWERMAEDGFSWWRRRLQSLANYFDTYRIDHILGFFRIWEIERDMGVSMLGHYYPARPFHLNELRSAGMWDIKRLVKPYIRLYHLRNLWPDARGRTHVIGKYLNDLGNRYYEFKDEYSTRAKLKAALVKEFGEFFYPKELLRRLSALLGNVIFVADAKMHDFFHPRVACYKTDSFAALPDDTKHVIERFHSEYYGSRNESMFYHTAMQRLPSLKEATRMMVCGEDLGSIPQCVPAVFDQLAILSLRVQRTSRNDDDFAEVVEEYPYFSVCTTSTHDFSPLRLWWEHISKDDRNQMWFDYMHQTGYAPRECTAEVVRIIINQHLSSPSMWAIFPLQDILPLCASLRQRDAYSEWINDPANPKNYWKYRCHLSCKELMDSTLPEIMSDLIFHHGRNPKV